jgi:hypothetical protein
VLLTTHYLEEAEALCGRIAMLKQGHGWWRWQRTSELLKAASSNVLRFKIDSELATGSRREGARVTGRIVQLPAHNALLRSKALPGRHPRPPACIAEDVEIRKADLEDVFLDVMRRWQTARPFMSGWQTLFYKEVLRFWKVSFQTVAAPVLTAVLYMLIFGHVLDRTTSRSTAR